MNKCNYQNCKNYMLALFSRVSTSSFPSISILSLSGGEIFFPVIATLTDIKNSPVLTPEDFCTFCITSPIDFALQVDNDCNALAVSARIRFLSVKSISYSQG